MVGAATMVRKYKDMDAYQKDAVRMAQAGWRVSAMTESQPRAGCRRILVLGLFAAVFKPKPVILVTYVQGS